MKKNRKDFILMNVGIFLLAFGIHLFRNPNGFATGGVSGLSLLLSKAAPVSLPVGAMMMILNLVILALGFVVLGWKQGSKSVYGTVAISGMLWLMEVLFPIKQPLTNQKFLEFTFSVLIPGLGSSLVFSSGGTTGGTDIVALIIKKYSNMKIPTALLIADFLIAAFSYFVFGIEAALYSVLGVCARSFLMDSIMESLRVFKIVVIISAKNAEIKEYINHTIRRGATVHRAYGAYTHDEKEVITTVLGRRQANILYQFIKSIDPEAFITISNSTEIIGRGFGGFE